MRAFFVSFYGHNLRVTDHFSWLKETCACLFSVQLSVERPHNLIWGGGGGGDF